MRGSCHSQAVGAWRTPSRSAAACRDTTVAPAGPRSPRRRPRPAPAAASAAGGRAGGAASWQPYVAVPALPQEVLLERDLHGVGLRAGDHDRGLARGEHVIGEDHDAVAAGVHHAHGGHLAEVLVLDRRLALDRGDDVAAATLAMDS